LNKLGLWIAAADWIACGRKILGLKPCYAIALNANTVRHSCWLAEFDGPGIAFRNWFAFSLILFVLESSFRARQTNTISSCLWCKCFVETETADRRYRDAQRLAFFVLVVCDSIARLALRVGSDGVHCSCVGACCARADILATGLSSLILEFGDAIAVLARSLVRPVGCRNFPRPNRADIGRLAAGCSSFFILERTAWAECARGVWILVVVDRATLTDGAHSVRGGCVVGCHVLTNHALSRKRSAGSVAYCSWLHGFILNPKDASWRQIAAYAIRCMGCRCYLKLIS
jgi:hypothetical protein